MPIGVITNVASVVIGGIIGAACGSKLSDDFKLKLNMIFGICAMGMGVSSVGLMENMPAVILAVILGTCIGLAIHLGEGINRIGMAMQNLVIKAGLAGDHQADEAFKFTMLTGIVLFCSSGTGIYGCLDSGMTGDHTILIAKSVLDLFTALIFACQIGIVTSLIAIPQTIIFMTLFFLAKLILPLTTPTMINDFKACGGFLLLATSFRMLKLRDLPLADMIPAMVIVMPLSYAWVNWIAPLM